mmetsp:Transcript_80847/g.233807  ORF Transcript_80847/g.233807 Transcript_80847/m.233807 type:complete len:245 (-) Transcript_80847:448-1182(-)
MPKAFCAWSIVAKVTKQTPFEAPSGVRNTLTRSTSPASSKNVLISSSAISPTLATNTCLGSASRGPGGPLSPFLPLNLPRPLPPPPPNPPPNRSMSSSKPPPRPPPRAPSKSSWPPRKSNSPSPSPPPPPVPLRLAPPPWLSPPPTKLPRLPMPSSSLSPPARTPGPLPCPPLAKSKSSSSSPSSPHNSPLGLARGFRPAPPAGRGASSLRGSSSSTPFWATAPAELLLAPFAPRASLPQKAES